MVQRFLFIGVGGSGGDTLRYLYQELLTRLNRIGIAEMPTGWQFLHIDAAVVSEESPELPALPISSYRSLVAPNLTYGTVTRAIDRLNDPAALEHAWLPEAHEVHVAVQHGAGQFRAIGRALTLYAKVRIRDAVAAAVSRLEGNEAEQSLTRVQEAMRGEAVSAANVAPPAVVVVSSLAGGTGAGAFLDVCDVLHDLGRPWAADSAAVLYAPDVFHSLSQDKRQGVQANALAAISELAAAHWNTMADGERADGQLLRRPGEPARRGPARSFVIGSGNEVLPFEEQKEVFAAVARTLTAWAMSPSIQQQYLAYVWGNWQQAATGADPMGLVPGNVEAPFSSLGYSSVGLGREQFHVYAAQCIGRLAAERLLHGAGGAAADDPAHIDRDTRIQRRWPSFLMALQLDSPGERTAGAFLERLAPPRRGAVRQECDSIQQQYRDKMYSLPEWRSILRARIDERRERFVKDQEEQTVENAHQWTADIQKRLLREVEEILLTDGLPVALGLVERVGRLIDDDLILRLEGEALQDAARAERYGDEINEALGEEARGMFRRRSNTFPVSSLRVETALTAGAEAAFGRASDAQARRTAAELLGDLRRYLLKPFERALADGLAMLRRDAQSVPGGKVSMVGQWPSEPSYAVPAVLHPRPNQFLIDPVTSYPAELARLLQDTAAGEEDPFYFAVKQVILGSGPLVSGRAGAETSRALIVASRNWQPELARVWSDNRQMEQTAVFEVRITGEDLLQRARRWCGDDQIAIGAYIHQSLQDALGRNTPSLDERQRLSRFDSAFTAAIRASAPLVRLDPGFQALAGGENAPAQQPLITAIPLVEGTEAYRTALGVLTNVGNFPAELAARRFDEAGPAEIEMTTFLDRPYHHAAFESLTRPILEDWEAHRRIGREAVFSHWRRARPLPEAVPVDPGTRLRIVRGFFIAYVDEMIDVDAQGRRVTIKYGDKLAFPEPLLGPPVTPLNPFDCLAALLESMSLALVAATNNDEPLMAYRVLALLGDNASAVSSTAYQDFRALLTEAEENYPLEGPMRRKRAWEIRRDIHRALEGLIRGASEDR
ncbi:MAG TPA: tubulin-like doman-containing protein [Actinoplanes sp.]|nr:tubulin-like doman-containing protein [Actinoplanes sp.]